MEHAEAVALIRGAVSTEEGTWADLGAGSGVFTRALSELLGRDGLVYAVDRNASALHRLREMSSGARVVLREGDFTKALDLEPLDGILMANALHFVRRHERVVSGVLAGLKRGGAFVLVEYDLQRGNPWVPFPVSLEKFRQLAPRVGLTVPRPLGRRRSRYGHGDIYAAVAEKLS